MHRPIVIKEISLNFPGRKCFHGFTTQIAPGSRIGIIGRNGTGKSSLLKLLSGRMEPSSGEISVLQEISIGYVEQTIDNLHALNGGERFNRRLTSALASSPDLLLLDEPTNHLDLDNRKSLMRMLEKFQGTLIIVSHDPELLGKCMGKLWHIEGGKVHEFSGSHADYTRELIRKREGLESRLSFLKQEKRSMHQRLMKEQERAAKSRAKGKKGVQNKKYTKMAADLKTMQAERAQGKNRQAIDAKKEQLEKEISELSLPEVVLPRFSLRSGYASSGSIVSICEGAVGYVGEDFLLRDITFNLLAKQRAAIGGKNGSGKSTFLKALIGNESIKKTGDWIVPKSEDIGYLDQHYANLCGNKSVRDHLKSARPDWSEGEIRQHLSAFLFRRQEEISILASDLSGGEKARLELALIAASPPKLLILDEITNNLDLETKEHVIQILREYPGAMLVVSHEEQFLSAIGIDVKYTAREGKLS